MQLISLISSDIFAIRKCSIKKINKNFTSALRDLFMTHFKESNRFSRKGDYSYSSSSSSSGSGWFVLSFHSASVSRDPSVHP